jgi:hypothetical protein
MCGPAGSQGRFQPAGWSARKGDPAGKTQGGTGQAAAVVERQRRRRSGQEPEAGSGRKSWIGTAGMARTPNPVARRGAGIAGKTTGSLNAGRKAGGRVGLKDSWTPIRRAGKAFRKGSVGEDPARNRLSRKVQAASGRGYCEGQPWF